MKSGLRLAVISLLAVVAFGQNPSRPSGQASSTSNKATTQSANTGMAEMKTESYKGILVDASCATSGGGSTAATTSKHGSTTDTNTTNDESGKSKEQKNANRGARSDEGTACHVSSNTRKFALKMPDGRIVKFDDIGNDRTQEALTQKKKWSEQVSGAKPIQVKVNGVLNGDTLMVVSIG